MTPKLIVEQKITPFVNHYCIYAANAGGDKGEMLAFAQQKRLAFKEKVSFYSDEAKTQLAFTFRAEKVLDVHGRYFVEDLQGNLIGAFKKEFTRSLFFSTWTILDADGNPVITISESNKFIAILRRFGGIIPVIGGLVELVMLLFKYHFVLAETASGQIVGRYEKTTLIRDHYQLSMTGDANPGQDWRVLAAVSVALDALQSR